MNSMVKLSIDKFLAIIAALTTLIMSPWINKDAIIIPKMMILILSTFYLLPTLVARKAEFKKNKLHLAYLLISVTLATISIIVMILSEAPFTQQFYGRTGRGLGFITFFSLTMLSLIVSVSVTQKTKVYLIASMSYSALIVSIYSIFQSFGLDFGKWILKTNGVIGTLGNPNFVSSFLAMSFMPTVIYIFHLGLTKKTKFLVLAIYLIIYSYVIFVAQSTQGYINTIAAVMVFSSLYFWYKNRKIFFILIFISIVGVFVSILGALNMGPGSYYLYKISVQSRGDFWRSAFSASKDNPFFGVGIDSFGDYFLKYRDAIAVGHPWAEYSDNAHNYLLEYAATYGYLYLVFYIIQIILIFVCFFSIQRKMGRFDSFLGCFLSAILVFNLQSLISPGNIVLLLWNSLICGWVVGTVSNYSENPKPNVMIKKSIQARISMLLVGFLVVYPLYNSDRLQLRAMNSGNAKLAVESAKKFPESVVRYSTMTRELLNSGLYNEALDLARAAVKFNPNSPSLWVLILVNPAASLQERKIAQTKILELDPLNLEIKELKIS